MPEAMKKERWHTLKSVLFWFKRVPMARAGAVDTLQRNLLAPVRVYITYIVPLSWLPNRSGLLARFAHSDVRR